MAAFALSAAASATAGASPVWKFNGTELTGKETVVGAATSSKMTVLGVGVECKHFLYNSKVFNEAGSGKGEITELPLFECASNDVLCPLAKEVEAKSLPWPGHLATVGGKDYVFIGEAGKEVEVEVVFTGIFCSLFGRHIVKGTVAGVVNNSAQTATFDSETFKATGTGLFTSFLAVEWAAEFTVEAFESHRLQNLEA
ncbi:MAG TPA: hypothetical protein VNV42_01675 [Solirubrobacteraceae bacterium]|nr:hypothetical protein [Solirubrobacteraceae bacterium]